ncbi:unnamed protein product, partial [Rotaria sp. Silwood1]
FFKLSQTSRHPITPPKNASTTASPYFPITVLYEDKSGKSTPYELVLKPSTTIGEMKKEIEHATRLLTRQQNWTVFFGAKDSHSTLIKQGSEDEPMDVDHVIDLKQDEDDIHSLPRLSNTTTITNVTSNRELLILDRCTDDIMGLEHFRVENEPCAFCPALADLFCRNFHCLRSCCKQCWVSKNAPKPFTDYQPATRRQQTLRHI